MKKWILLGAILLLLLPRHGTDVGELLPVEILLIERDAGRYQVSTDTGSSAWGRTLKDAMDGLREEAPGVIFLDTADYVLLTAETRGCLGALSNYVRPGTRVYELQGSADLSEIGPFLRAHGPNAPLYCLQKEEKNLAKLRIEGDGLRFEEQ